MKIPINPDDSILFDLLNVIKGALQYANSDRKVMIVLQGGSTTGKSTISKHLAGELEKCGIKNMMIPLDNYYKTFPGDVSTVSSYDFDNPAAIDWQAVRNTISDLSDNKKSNVRLYEYSFKERISQEKKIINPHPKVLIIEGIFGFNIVNDLIFNIAEFDPFNSNKEIENEYIKNNFDIINKFNILRVKLNLSKDKMRNERCKRDVSTKNFTAEESLKRFEEKIWPATEKWINSEIFEHEIEIESGSFNERGTSLLNYAIISSLGFENSTLFEDYISCIRKNGITHSK